MLKFVKLLPITKFVDIFIFKNASFDDAKSDMIINDKEFTINPLTYTIVYVWKKPLLKLPTLESVDLKNFFDLPEQTELTIDRTGIVVQQIVAPQIVGNIIMPALQPFLQFGFDRMTLQHTKYDNFLASYAKLEQLLKPLANLTDFTPQQLGVNIEYEVIISGENSVLPLNNLFRVPSPNDFFLSTKFEEVKLKLVESGNGKSVNLIIQPRFNNDHNLFIQVNDHFETNSFETFVGFDRFTSLVNDSINKLEAQILPSIF